MIIYECMKVWLGIPLESCSYHAAYFKSYCLLFASNRAGGVLDATNELISVQKVKGQNLNLVLTKTDVTLISVVKRFNIVLKSSLDLVAIQF